ncbi:MAG: hypothetical protein ABSE67_10730 [Xanthobacteraceae bacterium]|jgi:hypothetical protein
MADDERKEKTKTTPSKGATEKAAVSGAVLEKRKALWNALNDFIRGSGGWVVSLPGATTLRVEIPQGTSLPAKLIELGYSPRHCGNGSRITPAGTIETITEHSTGKPVIRHHAGIIQTDVFETSLPGA